MLKITPGGLILWFIERIAQNRPYNKLLINLVRSVITGKSQIYISALLYLFRSEISL